MTSKIMLWGCGGAGISAVDEAGAQIDSLGDGFCSVKYHYIDTSRANIDKITPKGEFHQIVSMANSGDGIDGSGSERKTHANDIVDSVKKCLDNNKYFERVKGEYHVVCASASGASGSISSNQIVKHLITRDIPVVAVVIGDSSNLLYTKNTINTLASLDAVAKQTGKAITVIYINNHSMMNVNNGIAKAEKEVNKYIGNILTTLSLFLSNEHENIDNEDMYNILVPSNYKQIKVQPGLYGLMFFSKEIKPIENAIPVIGRSLTLSNKDVDLSISLLHHKFGVITSTNAIGIVKEDNIPLHMISFANYFVAEQKNLVERKKNYENIAANITNEALVGCEDGEIDESGLIL